MFDSRDFSTLNFAVNCSEFAMRSAIDRTRYNYASFP